MGKLKPTTQTKSNISGKQKPVAASNGKSAGGGNVGRNNRGDNETMGDTLGGKKPAASNNATSMRNANAAAEAARSGVDRPKMAPSTAMNGSQNQSSRMNMTMPSSAAVQESAAVQDMIPDNIAVPTSTESSVPVSSVNAEPVETPASNNAGVSSAASPSFLHNLMSKLPIPHTNWNVGGMNLAGVNIRNNNPETKKSFMPFSDENGNADNDDTNGSKNNQQSNNDNLSPNINSDGESSDNNSGLNENDNNDNAIDNQDGNSDNDSDSDTDGTPNTAASALGKLGKGIANGSKPQDIAKDMKDKVGDAVKNLGNMVPEAGSLINNAVKPSLTGSLNNPNGLNNNGRNGNGNNGKKNKTPLDKLKGRMKRALIKAALSHLIPILVGVMALGAVGSCSAAMFTGNSNTEIEQTRGQDKPIVFNYGSNSNSSNTSNDSSSTPFNGDWVYYDQSNAVKSWGAPSQANWNAGCGTVGNAMILSTYAKDKKYNPTWLVNNGWTESTDANSNGVYLSDDPSFCKKVNDMQDVFHLKATSGLEIGQWKENWDQVKKTCSNGGAVLLGQDTISATDGSHYIVIQKVENGIVTYANPYGGKQETIEESKLLSYGYSGNTTQTIYFDKI